MRDVRHMTLTLSHIDEIERGCAGVTPGPWRFVCGDDPEDYPSYYPNVISEEGVTVGNEGFYGDRDQNCADARHISRLDPDTVRELCRRSRMFEKMRETLLLIKQCVERLPKEDIYQARRTLSDIAYFIDHMLSEQQE